MMAYGLSMAIGNYLREADPRAPIMGERSVEARYVQLYNELKKAKKDLEAREEYIKAKSNDVDEKIRVNQQLIMDTCRA